jgi:hypothetical protein
VTRRCGVTTTAGRPVQRGGAFRRLVGEVSALGRHRVLVTALVVAAIAGALVLDLAFPSYPIAGFYLVPVTLAALTLLVRATVVVALVCLGLGLYVIVIQDRFDGPTVTIVGFSALSGAALIALSYLFKEVDQLFENERSTTRDAGIAGGATADPAGGGRAGLGPAALRPPLNVRLRGVSVPMTPDVTPVTVAHETRDQTADATPVAAAANPGGRNTGAS